MPRKPVQKLKVKTLRFPSTQLKIVTKWAQKDGVNFSAFMRSLLEREGHRRLNLPMPDPATIWERLAEVA